MYSPRPTIYRTAMSSTLRVQTELESTTSREWLWLQDTSYLVELLLRGGPSPTWADLGPCSSRGALAELTRLRFPQILAKKRRLEESVRSFFSGPFCGMGGMLQPGGVADMVAPMPHGKIEACWPQGCSNYSTKGQ